jgi:uncharacterized membrane protein
MLRTLWLAAALASVLAGCEPGPANTPDESAAAVASAAPAMAEATTWQCGDLRVSSLLKGGALQLSGPFGVRTLAAMRSASGARYGDDRGTEFWDKAGEAMLTLDGQRQPDCSRSASPSPWDAAQARGIGFRAIGNEPGWLVEVGRGDAPALHAVLDFGSRPLDVARATATPDGFSGQTADGALLTLTIQRVVCSDSMSGQDFPASAVLSVGDSTYRGCGRFLHE